MKKIAIIAMVFFASLSCISIYTQQAQVSAANTLNSSNNITNNTTDNPSISNKGTDKKEGGKYYSCTFSLGVGGKAYQEYDTEAQCKIGCPGTCVEVEKGKDALNMAEDIAWVGADSGYPY